MDIVDTLSTLTMTKEEIEFLASAQPDVKVRSTNKAKKDATQVQMMVESRANEDYTPYNRKAIINSLLNATALSKAKAIEVAKKAEEVILKSNAKVVKTQFIREVVNQILFDMNIDQHLKYSSLSISLHDMETIFSVHNFENSNTDYTPESINLVTAGSILKQYALRKVFPHDIAEAHLKCDIHLHDLDFINRPYCSGNSIEYIKKNGLKLPNVSSSLPATHAQTLVNHLQCFASYLQGLFAGAIGFTAVNTFFSPLLVGLDYKSIKQVAQHLIFSFAQLAGNRGGQVVFSDFNMDLRTPSYLKTTPAVGAGGTYTGKTYKEYEEYSRLFLEAVIEVLAEGDADGANFAFPKILLHLTSQDLDDPILLKVCELNSK